MSESNRKQDAAIDEKVRHSVQNDQLVNSLLRVINKFETEGGMSPEQVIAAVEDVKFKMLLAKHRGTINHL